jgi:hypothetical protein
MNQVKLWPHLTIVFVIFAALGVGAAVLWIRHEPTAEALALPSVARIERVEGDVGLHRNLNANATDEQWIEVTPNTPITTGDRLYARDNSSASVAFTGRNFARIEPNSSIDVVSLADRRTQLALREGSAIFNIGALAPGELFEVGTPYGAVDFQEPGLYQMGYNDDGSAFVSVLSGLAQVVGLAGSGQISKGEMLTLLGQTAAQIGLSRINPDYAGGLVDDYYGYQYPDIYDGRYSNYDAYLSDPYYFDPYQRYPSYRYVSAAVPGAYELDRYGDWQSIDGYGYAWSPRVDAGWAPYQQGNWMMDDPHGLTWVSSEPWGYAPYHYGRWLNTNNRWYWIPDGVNAQPVYSPALVAFVPLTDTREIAWVPLAPGEQYAPRIYDANWQPHYVDGHPMTLERLDRLVNFGAPNGVTVIPLDAFGRPIDRATLARFDRGKFENRRPLFDPLSNAILRQMSLDRAIARRGFVLPPGLAKRLSDRQIFTSTRPPVSRFRDDLVRDMRVEVVPDKHKKEKLRFVDERQVDTQRIEGKRGDAKEMERLTRPSKQREKFQGRAARGDEVRRIDPVASGIEPIRGDQRPLGERVGSTRHAEKEAERQQARAAQQMQRVAEQQQRMAAQQQRATERQQRHAAGPKRTHTTPQQQPKQQPQQQVVRPQSHEKKRVEAPVGQPRHGGKPEGQGPGKAKGKGKGE